MSISLRGDASKFGCRGGAIRWGFLALLAAVAGLVSNNRAQAQITVKSLIEKSVPNATEKTYPEVASAITRFMNKDPQAALGLLTSAKVKNPKLPPPDMMLAQMWLMANRAGEARGALEECVKNYPNDPEAYLVLGDMSFSDRQVTAAELLFSKAEQLAANFTENAKRANDFRGRAEAGLAAVAESREQWETAKKYLENWVKIVDPDGSLVQTKGPGNPLAAAAHDRLGKVFFHLTGAPDAYKQFKYAVNADDKSISPEIILAQLYEEDKKNSEADNHTAAKRFISFAVTHLNGPTESQLATLLAAASWALNTNQADDAFNYASQALKLDPKSKRALEAKFLIGVAARMKGDVPAAEKALQDVFVASPGTFQASNQLAQVLAEQDLDKEKQERGLEIATNNQAVATANNGAQRDPGRAIEAAATLGWVYFKMDQIPQADQVTQAIMNTGVASPDILYYRAKLYEYHGNTKDAIASLAAALKGRGFFVHRVDAEQMLSKLDHSHVPDSSSTDTKPSDTTPSVLPSDSATPDKAPDSNKDKSDKNTDKASK